MSSSTVLPATDEALYAYFRSVSSSGPTGMGNNIPKLLKLQVLYEQSGRGAGIDLPFLALQKLVLRAKLP